MPSRRHRGQEFFSVYFPLDLGERLRRTARERGVPAAAILRAGLRIQLDELDRLEPGFTPEHVRQEIRVSGPLKPEEDDSPIARQMTLPVQSAAKVLRRRKTDQ